MRLSLIVPLLLAAGFTAFAQQPMPRMTAADPDSGKAGDVITVAGENLEKTLVSKVFLTDGKIDTVVEVTEQAATSIKFKVPAKTSGRHRQRA